MFDRSRFWVTGFAVVRRLSMVEPDVDLERLFEKGNTAALDAYLHLLHPADIAELFEHVEPENWTRITARLAPGLLAEVLTDTHMTLEFRGRLWRVEHFFHDDHVAAVTYEAQPPDWHVADESRDSHPMSAGTRPSGTLRT